MPLHPFAAEDEIARLRAINAEMDRAGALIVEERDRLRDINSELLAALEGIVDCIQAVHNEINGPAYHHVRVGAEAMRIGRAVIAKAKLPFLPHT